MSPSITNTMRRFSRSSSVRNSQNSQHSRDSAAPTGPHSNQTPPTSYTPPLDNGHGQQPLHSAPNGGAVAGPAGAHTGPATYDSRPVSVATNSSFDFMSRPVMQQHHGPVPSGAVGALSRTDQVVLRYFWEDKYADNAKRDLHFVSVLHTVMSDFCGYQWLHEEDKQALLVWKEEMRKLT